MERYQRVYKPRPGAPIKENEVRITTQGLMRNYISYATTLLQENRVSEIVLKAMGRAINKAVMLAEIIKKRMAGLHQNVSIGSLDITDVWEPLEEGLVPVETTRYVSMIAITLSKKALDTSSSGYQPPLVEKGAQPPAQSDGGPTAVRGRGSGRGQARGRGMPPTNSGYYSNNYEDSASRGRGQTRGRGRGSYRGGRGYNGRYTQTDSNRYDYGYGDGDTSYARGSGRGWRGESARGQRQGSRGRQGRGR